MDEPFFTPIDVSMTVVVPPGQALTAAMIDEAARLCLEHGFRPSTEVFPAWLERFYARRPLGPHVEVHDRRSK